MVSHLSNKQVNLPVLQNVHLKAEGGSIVLSTTNLEIATRINIRGKIDKTGEFTVPAKLFHDFVSLLPNDRVDVERIDNVLEVRCGDTATKINGIDAAEFPLIPQVETSAVIKMPAQLVRDAFSQVAFAVSRSEARPELSGVLLKFHENTLTLAATDSYRLSERKVLLQERTQDRQIIIPAQTVSEVSRMLAVFKDDPEGEDILELKLSDSQVVFAYGPAELITRTIEGNYPDYTQIIPTVFKTEVIVGRNEFIKAIKTASLFSRQGVFDIILQILPEEKKLTVTANEVTRGTNVVSCEAGITGTENKMTVNFRYLLDGLNAMSSEGVTLKMIDAVNPCLVMPNGLLELGSQTYIVMPIRQ